MSPSPRLTPSPRSRGPVFDCDSGNRQQVGILRYHGAMRKRSGDGPDLHVDLLNDSTGPLQLGENASEFSGGLLGVLPEEQPRNGAAQTPQIALSARTTFDSGPKFTEDGNANADAMPQIGRAHV